MFTLRTVYLENFVNVYLLLSLPRKLTFLLTLAWIQVTLFSGYLA
jgi:hypothetical protein